MLKQKSYPKCCHSFLDFCQNNKVSFNKDITRLLRIRPFDVTLRDGLQGLANYDQLEYTTDIKKQLYKKIIDEYNPVNLEIGSCVNTEIFPIFKDTEDLFTNIQDNKNKYILIPNQEQLMKAIKFGATNFSFITSVSNSFQLKNTKLTLYENSINLNNMMRLLDDLSYYKNNIKNSDSINDFSKFNVKLYVSCINECPIEGKISTDLIFNELFNLSSIKFDKICLSDTCGTLTNKDFINIIERLYTSDVNITKFSLHLHVNPYREDEIQDIVHTALDYGIEEFDVSYLKSGGCSVTIDKNKLSPNMSYEQYYKFLINYLIK